LVPGGPAIPWPPQDERLTERAREALRFAQDEAAALNHNHVGPVHLFVGLVHEREGPAAGVFAEFGITLEEAQAALAGVMGHGETPIPVNDITLTPRAQNVVERATHESRRMAHPLTDSAHLLFAVVRENDGFTPRVIASLGVSREDLRAGILARLNAPSSYGVAEHATPTEGPYGRFDDTSKRVLAFAREEAVNWGHNWVGGEHLVVGLARFVQGSGSDTVVGRVFVELRLTVERLRQEISKLQPPKPSQVVEADLRLTAATKLIIELAINEAGSDRSVFPEHILLAIGDAHDSFGGCALAQLGAAPEKVRSILNQSS
jgi:ATP-dependent Clp protease ATP-binding subunit ClpA